MKLLDYHCHTNFSQDCNYSMEEQCCAAIQRGVVEIAFTEHEDYNPDDPTSFYFQHGEYHQAVDRCQARFGDQVVIRRGIEISEPHRHPARVREVLSSYEWDFVLGSLHWVTPEINTYLPEFFTWLGDWRRSFERYFTEMIALARDGDFDVLAHLDYPARYGRHFFGDAYDIRAYEPLIRQVLQQLIARGKGIEINTSPWRRGAESANPPAVVLRWYHELGGTILTVGSDSHTPADVGADIARAIELAKAAGFTHLTRFERRQPHFIAIDALQ